MLVSLILFLVLSQSVYMYYLPEKYHKKRHSEIQLAQAYLQQFGYFEDVPLCPTKDQRNSMCAMPNPKTTIITEEEALKKFQQIAGLKLTGIIDRDTVEAMNKPRCENGDEKKIFKANSSPWKKQTLTYVYFNYTEQLNKTRLRREIETAFVAWSLIIPKTFMETNDTKNADIKILFAKGEHGDGKPFDGVGGILAHGFTDGHLHFDDDEKWKIHSSDEMPIPEQKDFFFNAMHEIGHVLGLIHSGELGSIMIPFYRNPVKREISDYYFIPVPISSDVENIQKMYGGKRSKASKNNFIKNTCTYFCFI